MNAPTGEETSFADALTLQREESATCLAPLEQAAAPELCQRPPDTLHER